MNWGGNPALILLLLQLTVFNSFSQNVQNFSKKIVGTKVEIRYDLVSESNDIFNITLFSSIDNFQKPLQQVSGDVGESVETGSGKLIIWDARKELGEFKGNIIIRLKSTLIPSFKFTNLNSGDRFRRGKSYVLTFSNIRNTGDTHYELYRGRTKIKDLPIVPDRWVWDISKGLKSGKDYKIKATTGNRVVFSPEFQISPRIPLALKTVPFLLVGGVVYVIISNSSSGGSPESNDIADPFLPDN